MTVSAATQAFPNKIESNQSPSQAPQKEKDAKEGKFEKAKDGTGMPPVQNGPKNSGDSGTGGGTGQGVNNPVNAPQKGAPLLENAKAQSGMTAPIAGTASEAKPLPANPIAAPTTPELPGAARIGAASVDKAPASNAAALKSQGVQDEADTANAGGTAGSKQTPDAALASAAEVRGHTVGAQERSALAPYAEAIGRSDADLTARAKDALSGKEAGLPVDVKAGPENAPYEAASAEGTVYLSSEAAKGAQAGASASQRADLAGTLREEVAEAAFQSVFGDRTATGTSKGDFGAEVAARAAGTWDGLSQSQKDAIRAEDDTTPIDTSDGPITGEAQARKDGASTTRTDVGRNIAENFLGGRLPGGTRFNAEGRGGNDNFFGTRHDDTFKGGAGADTAYGRGGVDTIYGNAGNDKIFGEGGNDKLYGNDGADTIYGGAGKDTIRPGNGQDKVYAGAGDDTIIVNNKEWGQKTIEGGAGRDTVVLENTRSSEVTYFKNGNGVDINWRNSDKRVKVTNVETVRTRDGSFNPNTLADTPKAGNRSGSGNAGAANGSSNDRPFQFQRAPGAPEASPDATAQASRDGLARRVGQQHGQAGQNAMAGLLASVFEMEGGLTRKANNIRPTSSTDLTNILRDTGDNVDDYTEVIDDVAGHLNGIDLYVESLRDAGVSRTLIREGLGRAADSVQKIYGALNQKNLSGKLFDAARSDAITKEQKLQAEELFLSIAIGASALSGVGAGILTRVQAAAGNVSAAFGAGFVTTANLVNVTNVGSRLDSTAIGSALRNKNTYATADAVSNGVSRLGQEMRFYGMTSKAAETGKAIAAAGNTWGEHLRDVATLNDADYLSRASVNSKGAGQAVKDIGERGYNVYRRVGSDGMTGTYQIEAPSRRDAPKSPNAGDKFGPWATIEVNSNRIKPTTRAEAFSGSNQAGFNGKFYVNDNPKNSDLPKGLIPQAYQQQNPGAYIMVGGFWHDSSVQSIGPTKSNPNPGNYGFVPTPNTSSYSGKGR